MRHHHTNLCRSQQHHAMGISLVVLPMKQEAMGKSREATGYTHREVTGNQSAKCKRKNRSLWALPQFCCLPSDPSEKWSAANISHIPWVRESSIILCWDTVNIIYIYVYISGNGRYNWGNTQPEVTKQVSSNPHKIVWSPTHAKRLTCLRPCIWARFQSFLQMIMQRLFFNFNRTWNCRPAARPRWERILPGTPVAALPPCFVNAARWNQQIWIYQPTSTVYMSSLSRTCLKPLTRPPCFRMNPSGLTLSPWGWVWTNWAKQQKYVVKFWLNDLNALFVSSYRYLWYLSCKIELRPCTEAAATSLTLMRAAPPV